MACPQCKCKVTYDCTPDDMRDDYEREKWETYLREMEAENEH